MFNLKIEKEKVLEAEARKVEEAKALAKKQSEVILERIIDFFDREQGDIARKVSNASIEVINHHKGKLNDVTVEIKAGDNHEDEALSSRVVAYPENYLVVIEVKYPKLESTVEEFDLVKCEVEVLKKIAGHFCNSRVISQSSSHDPSMVLDLN